MAKPKTQAQIDHATDARLLKKYGVGLAWYVSQLEKQGGGCAITGKPPGTKRLHVDHDHSWTKVKVGTIKVAGSPAPVWHASARYLGRWFESLSTTKRGAVREVKNSLKRASVRGLLSYLANVGLQKFGDNPAHLRAAAKYLEAHQGAA